MVPLCPTTVPMLLLVKDTPHSPFLVPLGWLAQLLPPSDVRSMVPSSPVAIPVVASANVTAVKGFPCGRGFCQTHRDRAGSARSSPEQPNNSHARSRICRLDAII